MKKWIVTTAVLDSDHKLQRVEDRLIPAKTEREAREQVENNRTHVLICVKFEGEAANDYLRLQKELHTRTNCIKESLKPGRGKKN